MAPLARMNIHQEDGYVELDLGGKGLGQQLRPCASCSGSLRTTARSRRWIAATQSICHRFLAEERSAAAIIRDGAGGLHRARRRSSSR